MAVDNQSALNYSLIGLAVAIWFVLYLFFSYLFKIGWVETYAYSVVGEAGVMVLPYALGLAGSGGAFWWARRNEKVNKFGIEVVVELKKVVWPTRKEVTGTTTAVLIVVVLVAAVLFLFDMLFGWFVSILVK